MIATQLFVTMIEIKSQDLVQDQYRENLEHEKENLDLDLDLVRFRKHEKENLVRGLDHNRKDLDLSHKGNQNHIFLGKATTTTKLIGRTTTTTKLIGPNLRHQKLLYPS